MKQCDTKTRHTQDIFRYALTYLPCINRRKFSTQFKVNQKTKVKTLKKIPLPKSTWNAIFVDHICDNRLARFAFWSCTTIVKPAQRARVGIIFSGVTDGLICPWCKVVLHSWEYLDELLSKHNKYQPNCKFIKTVALIRKL